MPNPTHKTCLSENLSLKVQELCSNQVDTRVTSIFCIVVFSFFKFYNFHSLSLSVHRAIVFSAVFFYFEGAKLLLSMAK